MTDTEVLNKAIGQASRNGYHPNGDTDLRLVWHEKTQCYWYEWDSEDEYGTTKVLDSPFCPDTFRLIFSHDFAKAFWGDGEKLEDNHWIFDKDKEGSSKRWQYHLQQMVLEENPLDYIRKFLDTPNPTITN